MNEIDDLKQEIKVLKKRIEILETKENNRKIKKNLYIIFKICLFLLTIYGLYKGYDYVKNNIPNLIESKIKEVNIIDVGKKKMED